MIKTLDKKELSHGCILHCYSKGFLPNAIRWFTKGKVNHTAIAVELEGRLCIIDSQANGNNVSTFENWEGKFKYNFTYHKPIGMNNIWRQEILDKMFQVMGVTGYDFKSLVIWQPWYIISGRWKGKRGEDAMDKLYCSELGAWMANHPTPWKVSPQVLLDWLNTLTTYKHIE